MAATFLATPPVEVAVPSVVVYELDTGIRKSSQPEKWERQLGALLDAARVLPFDRACAFEAARVRVELKQSGTPIGPVDVLIAGTVLAHNGLLVTHNGLLVTHNGLLVTHNVDDFRRIPGLRIVDWYQEL